jgi:hypothetical protein
VECAAWDETALALELQEIQEMDFDLSLTGFDTHEIDTFLALDDEEKANATPPLPESPVSRLGDLWLLGPHRVLCADATGAEAVARLLGKRKPRLVPSLEVAYVWHASKFTREVLDGLLRIGFEHHRF